MKKHENSAVVFGVGAVLAILLVAFSIQPLPAQTDPGAARGPLEILELGVMVATSGDGPRIDAVVPADWRLEKYQDVDLQVGDLIVAANGTRIETVADLREVIDGAAAGDKITLALKRLGKLSVAAYPKADETEVAAARAAIEAGRQTAPVVVEAQGGGMQTMRVIAVEGSQPWMDLAVLLVDVDGRIEVSQVLPLPPPACPDIKFAEGDVITSFQNAEVTTAEDLVAAYDRIESGQTVTVKYRRGDKTAGFTFDKPKPSGNRMMIRK